LDDVVFRTLERDPERRYQHVSEVKTDVEAIGSGKAPAVVRPGRGARDRVLKLALKQVREPAKGLFLAGLFGPLFWAAMSLTWILRDPRWLQGNDFKNIPNETGVFLLN